LSIGFIGHFLEWPLIHFSPPAYSISKNGQIFLQNTILYAVKVMSQCECRIFVLKKLGVRYPYLYSL